MSSDEAVGGREQTLILGRFSPRFVLAAIVVVVLSAMVGVGLSRYERSVPQLAPATTLPALFNASASPGDFPWPQAGQAAISVDGFDGVFTHGTEAGPQPIASTTKVMTALLILKHHPLQPGDAGPEITITSDDVRHYNEAIAEDQSTVGVVAGEKLTEYELLEGMLIASANNFANILADWDAGSLDAFVQSMNAEASRLGMIRSNFSDASGFSPGTTSTPEDLMLLARAGMAFPVFAEIVGKKSAELPVVGTIQSTNALLGESGIIGIKTGETDEAGDCLVFAADVLVNGNARRVYGVVLGQPDRPTAFASARALIESVPAHLTSVRIISKGEAAGVYSAPWAGNFEAVAANDLEIPAWAGSTIPATVALDTLKAPIAAGTKVGTLTVNSGGRDVSVDLVASADVGAPGTWWKLTR